MRVFGAATRTLDARQAGITGFVDLSGKQQSAFYSEIAFAPLILVLTVENTTPPDRRLVDITYFAASSYNAREATTVELPVLNFDRFLPGMYNT